MPVKRDQSLASNDMQGSSKRCKVDGEKHLDAMEKYSHLASNNAKLKGRRRFLADLEDMSAASASGFVMNTLRITGLSSGDDEGNLVFNVENAGGPPLAVTLMISDTSEYPEEHTFYAFSSSTHPNEAVMTAIQEISEQGSRTIFQTVTRLLRIIASALHLIEAQDGNTTDGSANDMDDGSDDDQALLDSDNEGFGIPTKTRASSLNLPAIQQDFLEIIACSPDYRPGFLRFGPDSFSLSVSLPVVSIPVPANALQAWDSALLGRSRHLTLLISGLLDVYPVLTKDGSFTPEATRKGISLRFQVGLTPRHKPSKPHAQNATRSFQLVEEEKEDTPEPDPMEEDWSMDSIVPEPEPEQPEDTGLFERFALSTSLEALLDHSFLNILRLRIRFHIGWAGGELMQSIINKTQINADVVYANHKQEIKKADVDERLLADNYALPTDPLVELQQRESINLPLVAFAYTLRRFMLCSRFCSVCHNKVDLGYEVLKPYVCNQGLCQYQFYDLNMGSSLEHEIMSRGDIVDVLVSTTYAAAGEGVLNPSPVGLALRVPMPVQDMAPPVFHAMPGQVQSGTVNPAIASWVLEGAEVGDDGLVDFDVLPLGKQCAAVKQLLDKVPSVADMKKAIEKKRKSGRMHSKVAQIFKDVPTASWALVRWCINSCAAHLEPLTAEDEMVQGVDNTWKQYRFTMGSPDAEAKFKAEITSAQALDKNARSYPILYAFHGSPLRNWHSIIRNGLWFKEVTHGRAYGHGVYFALQGDVSMSSYAAGGRAMWPNSNILPSSCVAVAEIVNLPNQFVSKSPYLVVAQTHWIVCRYLLVKSSGSYYASGSKEESKLKIPFVKLDPAFKLTIGGKQIQIPEPAVKLQRLLTSRKAEIESIADLHDEDDASVFNHGSVTQESGSSSKKPMVVSDDEDDEDDFDESWYDNAPGSSSKATGSSKNAVGKRPANDWQHDPEWVRKTVEHLIAPPSESSPMAIKAIQRELKAMLDEQAKAPNLKELGWYMPPEYVENNDNLFQWIVELHSFDEELPIARDMKAKGLNSLVFEIRFPSSFPHSPPFFRIIKPRFLPFIQGGGGHITGGGSMCMDLLTADGWLPSYSIAAVLLQIKLAISNLDPKPARLASNFEQPYTPGEALAGFQRAAATHGWKVPDGLHKMIPDRY